MVIVRRLPTSMAERDLWNHCKTVHDNQWASHYSFFCCITSTCLWLQFR
ncbi:hypothetical protein [Streptosporangium vulgare]|uniref:Uncharacterized protein n=1 Tax=Streptosporangium vulgare TaxID=46190 RepID=A0ABV5T5A6_9ACTN